MPTLMIGASHSDAPRTQTHSSSRQTYSVRRPARHSQHHIFQNTQRKICLRIFVGHGNFGASALRKDTAQVEPPTDDLANTTAGMHKSRATQATNRSPQRTRPPANGGPTPLNHERRATVEPRQPEVIEIEVTPEELDAMGFATRQGTSPSSSHSSQFQAQLRRKPDMAIAAPQSKC